MRLSRVPIRTVARACFLALAVFLFAAFPSQAAVKELVYSFVNNSGPQYPFARLLLGSNGKLYGTTSGGGSSNSGTVFELSRTSAGWTATVLYSFRGESDGFAPAGGLIQDAKGNLYGTASGGGDLFCDTTGCGTVFELSPANGGWSFQVLYTFVGGQNDGDLPSGDLVFDRVGNLYGATIHGGEFDGGVVFQLTPNGNGHWNETAIYIFGVEGGAPNGNLVFDSAGNLYGTTEIGHGGLGTVFMLTPFNGTWSETDLLVLGGALGTNPEAGLAIDGQGNLYGSATLGGGPFCFGQFGCGTVFELSPNGNGGWNSQVLYTFQGGADGQSPEGVLLLDPAGNLYGTTAEGGGTGCDFNFGCGTAFMLREKNSVWTETMLHRFAAPGDGQTPRAGVIFDGKYLLGTTSSGGADFLGTAFVLFQK